MDVPEIPRQRVGEWEYYPCPWCGAPHDSGDGVGVLDGPDSTFSCRRCGKLFEYEGSLEGCGETVGVRSGDELVFIDNLK